MLPQVVVRKQLGNLLAADATTLAPPANANKILLVAAPFTQDENNTPASFTLATFTGSNGLNAALGTQGIGVDPITGEQVITILPPAGGWRWICTVAPGSPETIYGYILVDKTGANLWGMAVLPTPVTITNVGDEVQIGTVLMSVVLQPIS